ncbi:HK97 family phage prohead protease [Rhodococcus koreensis]
MSDILYRSTELRAADTGRTVFGRVCPYGQTTEIREYGGRYLERFQPGAFQRSIRERGNKIKLLVSHDVRRFPIGKATQLEERSDGLHASFAIANTRDGDDTLELIRSGTVDSFSIGFRPIRSRQDGDVAVRVEAALVEVSLVGLPSYPGATVAGIRSAHHPLSVDTARRQLDLIVRSAWPDLLRKENRP